MKNINRTVSLLLSVVLTIAAFSIPADAVSSGGLKTYYASGSRFIAKTGLDYDIYIVGPTLGYFGSEEFNPGVLSQNYGTVSFNIGANGASAGGPVITDYYPKSNWAVGTDYPRFTVTLDGVLIFDGAELAKQHTAEMLSKGDLGLHSSTGRYILDEPITFNTRDLTVGKHTLVCTMNPDYMHEEKNASNNVSTVVFYIKGVSAAPSAPTLKNKTSTSITVNTVPGQEYSIDGGSSWQGSGEFSGLSPEATYEIVTRIAETDSAMASASSAPLTVTTKPLAPDAPPAPLLQSKTAAAITVQTVSGLEYSINYGEGWQDSGLFSGLSPNTMYQIAARVKATAEMPCSDRSTFLNVTTDKLSPDAPAAPVLEQKTDTSISVRHIPGAEYSIDGGSSWQTSPRFTGLHPNTSYSVTARYAETRSSYASPASPALSCTTKKGSPSAPSRPVLQDSTDSTITVREGALS